MKLLPAFLLLSLGLKVQAQDLELGKQVIIKSEESKIGTTLKKDSIIKTEILSKEELEHKQAQTLVDAVADEMGISAQTSCANCGSKRVSINGMRGEHTTILMDGVPLHSTISSFYGLDAVPVGGIDSIEISRGAGAALTSPEAIGGVINVKTSVPQKTGASARVTYGSAGDYAIPFTASTISKNKKFKSILAGQFSQQSRRDLDENGVAENPNMNNRSGFAKVIADISPRNRLSLRAGIQNLDNIGGAYREGRPLLRTGEEPKFNNNNVNEAFVGDPATITDWVRIKRQEFVSKYERFIGEDSSLEVTAALAKQRQDSVYNLHAFDYANKDNIVFVSTKFDTYLGEDHFFTIGFEQKQQEMTSQSSVLYNASSGLIKDDFRSRVSGVFLQDTWDITENMELASAVRVDRIQVDWQGKTAVGNEINEVLVSPRAHLKVAHNDRLTSRLSYGLGYRPPLSFFESQHGMNEYGFDVNITEIEKAHSYGYSLNYQDRNLNATASTHRTSLKNVAYADTDVDLSEPVSFQNYKDTLNVWVNDVAISYKATPNLTIALTLEDYQYDEEYKALQPNALIERRISLSSDYHWKNWEFVSTLNWVGSRDLSKYRYDKHFNSYAQDNDIFSPTFGSDLPRDQKGQKSPAFITLDLYASVKLNKQVGLFAGVNNVFDYTQIKKGDSPLSWSGHGPDPTHFHLDNNHIWGPLIGRTVNVGMNASF